MTTKSNNQITVKDLNDEQIRRAAAVILECTICLQPSASPIYECLDNGHFTCALCYEGLIGSNNLMCPLCKNSLRLSACAERISRRYGVTVTCPNEMSGCKLVKTADQIMDHMKICEYRAIGCICHYAAGQSGNFENVCKPVYMNEFTKHWVQKAKKRLKQRILKVTSNIFHVSFVASQIVKELHDSVSKSRDDVAVVAFPPRLVEYEGHGFLVCSHQLMNMWNWWVLVIGGQDEADKFKYETKLILGNQRRNEIDETVWNLPVLPFHKYERFDELCGKYAHCSTGRIAEFHISVIEDSRNETKQYDAHFTVQIQLRKV